ncbi:nck-associated protein 5-like [Astyanax mexicanus]|uniref:nck-associated protein 5-like n=1 Tax=Astyanax mexicanus TaxID=7994 RepID=UPI0020CB26A4|nr:nck-associated protein 5-like [Astyanax mexicanus]XP_049327699.1 nck-associated protein 5-like [Astyanax mexicanus]
MSEGAELRECDEAFESEEGDGDQYLEEEEEEDDETESSKELLERLRELEAENATLAQANENQREAYERCLDEVANHVVQALLNQKDLREECIKLKMRVFDLERQNKTLSELFTQKLHSTSNPLHQLPSVACPEHSVDALTTGTEKLTTFSSQGKVKGNNEGTQNGTGGSAQASASSMEAMSPFLKKKAHILEVLRKLEESDPLKFHPSACYYYHGQAVLPGETTVVTPAPRQPHCRHSSSDSDIHEYANGEGAQDGRMSARHGGCPSCRVLSQRSSLDSLLRCSQAHSSREADTQGQKCSDEHRASAQSTDPQIEIDKTNQPTVIQSRASISSFSQSGTKASISYLSSLVADSSESHSKVGEEPKKSDFKDKDIKISPTKSKGANSGPQDSRQADTGLLTTRDNGADECRYLEVSGDSAICENETSIQVCNGVFSSNETSISKKVSLESYSPTTSAFAQQQQASGKGKFAHSPTSPPSSFSESKPSPVSSPSKLLKFLKIPSMAENTPAANALRLSPQLTRNSKIPCRNNYEVYQSPVMSRKATTAERDKPPSTSKTDTYPSTHSAPTSPPKPEDTCLSVSMKESQVYSSHSAPKPSRVSKGANQASSQPPKGAPVPHYENILDPSASLSDSVNGFAQITPEEMEISDKHKMSLRDERLLSPPSLKTSDSSATTGDSPSDTSDQDTDTESPVWQRPQHHFSLPSTSSAVNKAQRTSYSSMKDRCHERGPPEQASAQKHDTSSPSQAAAKRSDRQPPLPKRAVSGKPQNDSSYHPFKERLAALGKLKSTEDLQQQAVDKREAQSNLGKTAAGNGERSKTAERHGERISMEQRHSKYTDSLDGKPYPKTSLGNYAKGPVSSSHEQSTKPIGITSSGDKSYIVKAEGQKIRMGMSSTASCETPVMMRSYAKCPNPLPHHSKTVPSPQSSPTRAHSKSPSKTGSASSSYPRGMKPVQDEHPHPQRHPSRTDDKSKLTPGKKKTFTHMENFPPPPPPRPGAESANIKTVEKRPSAASHAHQSAIEQKVMRGIEENMLKLQEQDRGQPPETKQKTSNGIASWFGLKKSKLPALNRKPETSKLKLNVSSSSSSSSAAKDASGAKGGPRKVVESLNISKLMEKAEDLRKALEEERTYVNRVGIALDRPGRGHSCEVVMDPSQGQLSLMYRGVTADNFMQQLLNRVDERGAPGFGIVHRRLSFDSKRSRPVFGHQQNNISHTRSREEMDKGSDMVSRDEITSDESLAESISSQHFTGSGSSMRTLDSGIGTFPLPDYASSAAGKGVPKPQGDQGFFCSQGKQGALLKAPRKARTLERELSSLDEVNPCVLYGSPLEAKAPAMHLSSTIHEDIDAYGAHLQTPPTKNWTFPNLRGSAGSTDVYLQENMEPPSQGTPSRRSLNKGVPQAPHEADPRSLPLPPQMGMSRQRKSRTHGAPEMPKEGGLELVKERPDDILSPSRPQALETPESLSDSLYDSLSSCGSQG